MRAYLAEPYFRSFFRCMLALRVNQVSQRPTVSSVSCLLQLPNSLIPTFSNKWWHLTATNIFPEYCTLFWKIWALHCLKPMRIQYLRGSWAVHSFDVLQLRPKHQPAKELYDSEKKYLCSDCLTISIQWRWPKSCILMEHTIYPEVLCPRSRPGFWKYKRIRMNLICCMISSAILTPAISSFWVTYFGLHICERIPAFISPAWV